jgi:hypothetical protein
MTVGVTAVMGGKAGVTGEFSRRSASAPVRALLIVTGILLITELFSLFGRYCLTLRRHVRLTAEGASLVLDTEWSILGKRFGRARTIAPMREISAIRLENRTRYLYMLVGLGALAVGAWVGIQWFIDGLRAGFPYLALVGAGVVAAGVLIDLGLYLLVPGGKGRSRLFLAIGPWTIRIRGVEYSEAERLVEAVRHSWQ